MNRAAVSSVAAAVVACTQVALAPGALAGPRDEMIAKHAAANGVPEKLIRRVIHIESRGNPRVISKGNYGLMQIRIGTARSMGYSGTVEGLLDADTNMTYAVKYLARAYRAAKCNPDRAVAYYQRGFYGAALAKCAPPQEPQVVRVEANALARSGGETAPVDASGVLQPRVVHVETFTKTKQAVPAPAKSAKFEPVRGATPQTEIPAVEPSAVQPAEPEVKVAKLDATAPLPRERPEIPSTVEKSESKSQVSRSKAKWTRHFGHRHAHRRAKAEKPVGLIAFLQKITAPEKKSRRRHSR